MNNCPEFVQTATEGGFPWVILVLVVLIVGGVYVWKNGVVGTEAGLKALAEKLKARADKIEAKWKAKRAKRQPVAEPLAPSVKKSKAERIAEVGVLLAEGKVSQLVHDAAVSRIAAE